MSDSDVREVHGCRATIQSLFSAILIIEQDQHAQIDLDGKSKIGLTPAELRHLAGKLYRVARRIEERSKP